MWRIQARGVNELAGSEVDRVALDVAIGDEWVYIRRQGGEVSVYSGPACDKCQLRPTGWLRCSQHLDAVCIGLQLRLL